MGKIKTAMSNPKAAIRYAQRKVGLTDIQRKMGRLVFGVDRPFSQHATGKLAVKRSQIRSESVQNGTSDRAEQLRRDGVLNLGCIYDDNLISSTAEAFDTHLEEHGPTYTRGHDGEDYTYGVSSTDFEISEQFHQLEDFVNSEIRKLLRTYYGSYFQPVRINMWRNRHVPPDVVSESEVFSNYWHFDPHTTDHVKIFIYLTDVSDDDGPFHYITKGESMNIASESFERKHDGVPNGKVEEMAAVQRFTGPKGSTAFCNTTTNLHRAGIPAKGNQRDLLQIVFAPASKPLPDDWFDGNSEMYSHPGHEHNGFGRLRNY